MRGSRQGIPEVRFRVLQTAPKRGQRTNPFSRKQRSIQIANDCGPTKVDLVERDVVARVIEVYAWMSDNKSVTICKHRR